MAHSFVQERDDALLQVQLNKQSISTAMRDKDGAMLQRDDLEKQLRTLKRRLSQVSQWLPAVTSPHTHTMASGAAKTPCTECQLGQAGVLGGGGIWPEAAAGCGDSRDIKGQAGPGSSVEGTKDIRCQGEQRMQ